MKIAALLATALLFGGMTLYSVGFASVVFSALKADVAGGLLRKAFPHAPHCVSSARTTP